MQTVRQTKIKTRWQIIDLIYKVTYSNRQLEYRSTGLAELTKITKASRQSLNQFFNDPRFIHELNIKGIVKFKAANGRIFFDYINR